MARSKTVSLKGDAAKAFIQMMVPETPQTEEDKYAQVCTLITMHVKTNQMAKAVLVLKDFERTAKLNSPEKPA